MTTAAAPTRVQLSRAAGWRLPPDTVVVTRPSKWGNPWKIDRDHSAADVVLKFRRYLDARRTPSPGWADFIGYPSDSEIRRELAGRNLACWCPPGQPCHADLLLALANDHHADTAPPLRIPALTIRRPWAALVIAGIKPVENRSWSTAHRGPFIVHAGQAWEPGALLLAETHDLDVTPWPAEHPTGYLGVANLDDIHHDDTCTSTCGPWCFRSQKHWDVRQPRAFAEPIPGPGRQGWFTPPDHVQQAARDLLAVTA
ncbi:DUF4326 domain-containing protein [Saccharothrix sp. HUAS TT1]|uniref:DUF4326 domain-containing protein n=1 Tax=unclassified Saccharothrix TaxID=2593673 RepID=UPI00345BF1B5